MISDGQNGNIITKKIIGCKPNKEYYDMTGNIVTGKQIGRAHV